MTTYASDRPRGVFGGISHIFLTFRSAGHLLPWALFAAAFGMALYNPPGYSVEGLIEMVIRDGLGVSERASWYYQPAYYLVALALIGLLVLAMFYWQIVRSELRFFIGFLVIYTLLNGLLLALGVVALGRYWFGWAWVHWQIVPALCALMYITVKLPKMRRQLSGAVTAGGGSLSVHEEDRERRMLDDGSTYPHEHHEHEPDPSDGHHHR